MIYLKIELKVLVDCLFCKPIVWLPYTLSDNVEIIIVATWSRSLPCSGSGRIEIPWRYLDFLNRANFSEGVECVFGFTEKCFCVARDDLDNVLMKGLGSKTLRIQWVFAKEIYIYIQNLIIDKDVALTLFYIVYYDQSGREKPPLLCSRYYYLEYFETLNIKIMSLKTQKENIAQYNLFEL